MNLGFDIDGVISDFVMTFNELAREKYNISLTEADIYCHDLNLVLGVTQGEISELIVETLKSDLELYFGAKETTEKLLKEGHKIYLLTARYEFLTKNTLQWLNKKGVCYTDILHLSEGKKYQANVEIDLIVEDCLQDALEWTTKVKHVLIYDHPWNRTKNVRNLVKRVKSWAEIYEEVQRLEVTAIKLSVPNRIGSK